MRKVIEAEINEAEYALYAKKRSTGNIVKVRGPFRDRKRADVSLYRGRRMGTLKGYTGYRIQPYMRRNPNKLVRKTISTKP